MPERAFNLPDLGSGLVEAEIVEWHVAVGDAVAVDQEVVDVETAKSVIPIPSPFAGTVVRLGGEVGETLEVGATVFVVEVAADAGGAEEPAADDGGSAAPASDPAAADVPDAPDANGAGDKVRAMPAARRIAREHGIDIAAIAGTGKRGMVTVGDVKAIVEGGEAAAPAPAAPSIAADADAAAAATPPAPRAGDERRPLSKMRRTIAAHMQQSWREIPHIVSHDLVDCEQLLALRKQVSSLQGRPLPIEALVVKALVPVLAEQPEFNATVEGDELVLHRSYDVAVAVDTPAGLMTVVVHGADRLELAELGDRIVELARQARERTIAPADLIGGTFTVSNVGAMGGGSANVFPIVPATTTALLSLGRAEQRPVVRDGLVVAAWQMPVDLSCDHRVIDGGMNRRFVAQLREALERPAALLER